MNSRGQQAVIGFALLIALLVFILALFAIINPLKEGLDDARDTTSLNCPGTTTFNQTAYDEDDKFDRLTRRPTCFVTGMTMVYFVGAFLIASFVWMFKNWRKLSK